MFGCFAFFLGMRVLLPIKQSCVPLKQLCFPPPHFAAPRRRVQRVTPCLLQTLWPKVDNTSKHHQGDVLSPRRCLGGFQWWRVDENMFPCFVGKDKIVRTSRNGILTCLACSLIYIHLESIPFLLSLWMEGFNSWSHQWIGKEPCTEPLGIWYLWSHAIQQSAPFLDPRIEPFFPGRWVRFRYVRAGHIDVRSPLLGYPVGSPEKVRWFCSN